MVYNIKLLSSDANTLDIEKDQSLEVQEVRVEEGQEVPHQGIEQINTHADPPVRVIDRLSVLEGCSVLSTNDILSNRSVSGILIIISDL